MTPSATARPSTALRRAVLVFSLREQGPLAEVEVRDSGVVLPGAVVVGWDELAVGCEGGADVDPAALARSVARWIRIRHLVAPGGVYGDPDALLQSVRPVALPVGHAVHPGPGWVVREVLGGSLDLGLGLRGIDDDGRLDRDGVGVLPCALLVAAGVEVAILQARAIRYLGEMAALAAERLLHSPSAPLRPLGDCDVVTLLAADVFRRAVVRDAPGVVGLRSAAIPVRRRGWLDLGRVDPAFALTAASLTEPDERGFVRPLLITADEVVQVRAGGTPTRFALADPLAPEPHQPVQRLH